MDNNMADKLVKQLDEGADVVVEKPGTIKMSALAVNTEDEKIEIGETQVGREFRSELVCKEDILKVVEYDKAKLQEYAHSRLGKELDLGKRIKQLRTEVVLLIKAKLKLPTDTDSSAIKTKDVPENENPEFVFNPVNRRIFEWTELLGKRTDLIPCCIVDLKGKRL